MKRKQILEILFWIFLILLVILILWKIFGNSPSDLSIIITGMLTLLLKMWSISDELKDFKYKTKLSFQRTKEDINLIKRKINKIKK